MPGTPQTSKRRRHATRASLLLGLLAVVAVAISAFPSSDSIHVEVSKKQILLTGTTATAGSIQVNFDPKMCASSYTAEAKRTGVAFTDLQVAKTGTFKFALALPIRPRSGDEPGHYACAYLLQIEGPKVKALASAVGRY